MCVSTLDKSDLRISCIYEIYRNKHFSKHINNIIFNIFDQMKVSKPLLIGLDIANFKLRLA